MPAIAIVTPSGDQDTDGLLSGIKWAVASLTYSFPVSAAFYGAHYGDSEQLNNFAPLNPVQQATVRTVLGMYSSVANLTFSEVTESSTVHGDLRFAQSDEPDTAWAYYPWTDPSAGDSWYNNSTNWYDTPTKGNYAYLTFIHEMGHALGLKHAHEDAAVSPAHDSMEYTVMSYRSYPGQSVYGGYTNGWSSYAQTLMMYDIAALQQMYGANYGTNSGDTTYSWNPITGEPAIDGAGQGAPGANRVFMTVWDGGGTDTYDFSGYTSEVSADLRPGSWTTTSADQLANLGNGHYAEANVANALLYHADLRSIIENVFGGSGADTLVGNEAANVIRGNGGSDSLYGREGDDWLDGGAGDDVLDGGEGGDSVYGGDGNDTLYVRPSLDTLDGGAGTDTVDASKVASAVFLSLVASDGSGVWTNGQSAWQGGTHQQIASLAGIENIVGSAYNDFLRGNDGDNVFVYTAGRDQFDGREGTDTVDFSRLVNAVSASLAAASATNLQNSQQIGIFSSIENLTGTAYADSLTGDGAANRLEGGAGNDTLNGNAGNDVLLGGAGDDTLDGGQGSDIVYGGDGSDALYLGFSLDTLDGGAGTDTVDASKVASAVFLSLVASDGSGVWTNGQAAWQGGTHQQIASLAGIENVVGSAYNDFLRGNNGDNVFMCAGGLDQFDGREGTDTVDFSRLGNAVSASLAAAGATNLQTSQQIGIFSSIENLTGTAYADSLTGDGAANRLEGGAGNDTLNGNAGNDVLLGGAGDDTLDGGQGSDSVYGGDGSDALYLGFSLDTLDGGAGTDTVDASKVASAVFLSLVASDGSGVWTNGLTAWQGGTHQQIASLAGIENVVGSAYNDFLRGNNGDNVFVYTAGLDQFDGREGTDTVDFSRLGNAVSASLAATSATNLQNSQQIGIFSSIENLAGTAYADSLTGDGNANRLEGGAGNDTLSGNGGNDVLLGGAGIDTLAGGSGSDRFYYNAISDGVDTITDFAAGSGGDSLDIRDVLSGYAQGMSPATDFVQLFVSGSDTTVRVNADGIGSDFVDVSVLQGVTGLLLNDLLAQGNLVMG